MTGSHSRLGISDRESCTTGVIRAYDNEASANFGQIQIGKQTKMERFSVESCMRAYHVYKDIKLGSRPVLESSNVTMPTCSNRAAPFAHR